MKCKRHPCEGGVGVCASCLRERLLALAASESPDCRRKPDPYPPPLVFPRSVSPYIHRRSAAAEQFYSTPQVGHADRRSKPGRFSLLAAIFRPRSGGQDGDPGGSSASAASWFSTLLPGRRKKKSRLFSLDEELPGCRKGEPLPESPPESGHVSESSYGSRKHTPGPWRRGTTFAPVQNHRSVSGFAFRLSPLARPAPAANRTDTGVSTENRHPSPVLCPNRTRKLADFGGYH